MPKLGAVIVASGYGTCHKVRGIPFPKVLERVGGKPMLVRIMETVQSAGIAFRVTVVNPFFGPGIVSALQKNGSPKTLLVTQPRRRGSGDAVYRALPLLKENGIRDFLVIYADMPLWDPRTIRRLVRLHRRRRPTLSMVTVPVWKRHPKELNRYGRVMRDLRGNITHIIEPNNATGEQFALSNSVNPSLWIWKRRWFEKHIPLVPFVRKNDGRGPERYLPPLVALAWGEGRTICELSLPHAYEALGVNDRDELKRVREIASHHRKYGLP